MAARKRARTKEREVFETAQTPMSRGAVVRHSEPFPDHVAKALIGRPTNYRPEYCQRVLELAAQGYSLGGFAGLLGVGRRTVNQWIDCQPDFAQACSRAAAGRQWFWETKLIDVANTGGVGSQGQVAIFGVLNAARCGDNVKALDYVNKSEIEHSGNVSLANVVERMMSKLDEIASKRAPGDNAIVIESAQLLEAGGSSANAPDDADFW